MFEQGHSSVQRLKSKLVCGGTSSTTPTHDEPFKLTGSPLHVCPSYFAGSDSFRYTECPYKGEPTLEEIKNGLPRKYLGLMLRGEGFNKLEVGESKTVLYGYRVKKEDDN